MGDGVSGLSMIALMQPSEDFSGLRVVSTPSFGYTILYTLMAPFLIPQIPGKMKKMDSHKSGFKQAEIVSD
jgi:hypothetical protein